MRLGELRALRWQDVDFAKRLVHVRRNFTHGAEGAPKSGRVRSVPLIDQAAKALDGLSRRERFVEPDDLVFVDDVGGHEDDWRLRNRFHAALTAAGLPRLRLHDLRHTFGTLAVQAFPLSDVRAYMGHADIATTMITSTTSRASTRLTSSPASSPPRRPCSACGRFRDTFGTRPPSRSSRRKAKPARLRSFRIGPAWIRTRDRRIMSPLL